MAFVGIRLLQKSITVQAAPTHYRIRNAQEVLPSREDWEISTAQLPSIGEIRYTDGYKKEEIAEYDSKVKVQFGLP